MSDRQKPIKVPKLNKKVAQAVEDVTDQDGAAEAEQLGSGKSADELKEEAKQREHDRNQKFKDHFENISIGGIYAASMTRNLPTCRPGSGPLPYRPIPA